MTHTPTPWTAEPPKHREDICGWKIANGYGVAHGWIATGYAPISPLSESDARLIAAAPDLLAALNRSLSWLSSYPGGGAIEVYNQARTAIAKAEGR